MTWITKFCSHLIDDVLYLHRSYLALATCYKFVLFVFELFLSFISSFYCSKPEYMFPSIKLKHELYFIGEKPKVVLCVEFLFSSHFNISIHATAKLNLTSFPP